MNVKCIAFDLDDTLVDTARFLIPQAARDCVEAMIRAGLNAEFESAMAERARALAANPRADAYSALVARFGARAGASEDAIARAGREAFLRRKIDPSLRAFPAAAALLARLRGSYKLYLISSGDPETQARKVETVGLASAFDAAFYVDPLKGERKREAFARAQAQSGALPEECLSVGNRVDSDVAEAKALGWKTCWIRHGEHARLEPVDDRETPDARIDRIEELVDACGL